MAGKNEKKCSSITINYLNKLGNLGCIKEQHLMPLAGREKGASGFARRGRSECLFRVELKWLSIDVVHLNLSEAFLFCFC